MINDLDRTTIIVVCCLATKTWKRDSMKQSCWRVMVGMVMVAMVTENPYYRPNSIGPSGWCCSICGLQLICRFLALQVVYKWADYTYWYIKNPVQLQISCPRWNSICFWAHAAVHVALMNTWMPACLWSSLVSNTHNNWVGILCNSAPIKSPHLCCR